MKVEKNNDKIITESTQPKVAVQVNEQKKETNNFDYSPDYRKFKKYIDENK